MKARLADKPMNGSVVPPPLRCLLYSVQYGRGVNDDPLTAWQECDLDVVRELLKRLKLDQERRETLVDEPVGVCLTFGFSAQSLRFSFCGFDSLIGLGLSDGNFVLLGDGLLFGDHLVPNCLSVLRVKGHVVDADLPNGDRITRIVQNFLQPGPYGLAERFALLGDFRAVVACRLFLQNVGKFRYEQLAEVVGADVVQDVFDCFSVDLDVDGDVHEDVLVVVAECFHPAGAKLNAREVSAFAVFRCYPAE